MGRELLGRDAECLQVGGIEGRGDLAISRDDRDRDEIGETERQRLMQIAGSLAERFSSAATGG